MTWLTTPPCPLSTHFSQTPHKMTQHLFIGFKVMSRFRLLTSEGSILSTVPSLLTPVPGRAVPSAPQKTCYHPARPCPPLSFSSIKYCHILTIILKEKKKNMDKVMPEPRKQFATMLMSLGVPFPFSIRILHCKCICSQRT